MTGPQAPSAKPIGRPRDPGLSEAALRVAIEIIVEDGYPHLTMERVAERAAASRTALYRRWPNKLDLAVEAISSFADTNFPLPDTGRLRDDVVDFLHGFLRKRRAQMTTYTVLSSALAANPELGERCHDVLTESFRKSFRSIIDRAIARGELPPGTDAELYADLTPALIRYRLEGTASKLDERLITRIADQFFSPAAPEL